MTATTQPTAESQPAYLLHNPSIFSLSHSPHPGNSHPSATLDEQQETERVISELLLTTAPPALPGTSGKTVFNAGSSGAAGAGGTAGEQHGTVLRKTEHLRFFQSLFFKMPPPYVSLDASRPWLMYWTVHSWDLLGIALDQATKDRAISTLLHMLSPLGGFAGGPANTQLPHLLPTYAATSSLAIVGNSGPTGGWQQLASQRQQMYDFLMRCKRADGGFVVCQGGEVDVRGTYCLLVVATLLDLLTPELLHNVDNFIAGCQTYEGGFACASYDFASSSSSTSPVASPFGRAAQAEAHGGYTSCALNSHFLLSALRPALSSTSTSLGTTYPTAVDVDAALRWTVLMQGEGIEAGGFRGRSNKLVDGCYSWWVGGGVPVLEELARREREQSQAEKKEKEGEGARIEVEGSEGEWEDVKPNPPLFNKVALQEFVLLAAQNEPNKTGGLRDKPGKRPDQYHSANNLSGLSIAQHNVVHSPALVASNRAKFDPSKGLPAIKPKTPEGGWSSEEERQRVRREVWSSALGWKEEGEEVVLGGKDCRVNTTAPVFNILLLRLKPFINYFYQQMDE